MERKGEGKKVEGERELLFSFFLLCFSLHSSPKKKKKITSLSLSLSYRERAVSDEVDRGLRDLQAEGLVGVLKVELFFLFKKKFFSTL